MTGSTPMPPSMPPSRDVRDPSFREALRDGLRTLSRAVIEDLDLTRTIAALLLLLAVIVAVAFFRLSEPSPGAAFNLAACLLLLYRLSRDVIVGSLAPLTFIVPAIAIGAAFIAYTQLVHPLVAPLQLPAGTLPLVLSISSIVTLVLCYTLVSGLLGEGLSTDTLASARLESRTALYSSNSEPFETPFEDVQPGWGPEAADCPHRYWVNYTLSHSRGYSQRVVAIARSAPITCEYDLRHMAEYLREMQQQALHHLSNHRVVITSWQRFESPETGPGARDDVPKPIASRNVLAFRQRGVSARSA